jgi:polyhydroxyalkanoate synthase
MTGKTKKSKTPQAIQNQQAGFLKQIEKLPDPYALSQALMHAYEQSQPVLQKLSETLSQSIVKTEIAAPPPDPLNVTGAFLDLISAVSADPAKHIEMQLAHSQKITELLAGSIKKFYGEESHPVIEPAKGDRRFRDEEWTESALFDFIKQYYLLANDYVRHSIEQTEGIAPQEKEKLKFVSRLLMEALSPSNFILTNPEVLKETIKTGGENLIHGLKNLSHDLERGDGELKISTTNYDAFKLGENIAVTPGAVVFENEMMQLLQYEPSSKKVFTKPLLIIPPWINKYYILDLKPESSYIKWAVDQGHTVFCISWVNPDKKLSKKTFSDYMKDGLLAALDQIQSITKQEDCNVVGYCLGGTLLATTMAYLSVLKQEKRIASASFLTTLIDFEHAGDMKFFLDDAQIESMEKNMKERGVLEARELQRTFSLLRANDLIWSFVVNNYLMGKEPFPFDLLYWNDDSTNMPAAMHIYYLKNMYRDNLLAVPGGLEIDGIKIDIRKIKTPCYFLSTREDHIAPWESTYKTTQMVSGPKVFTLAASGHIAGVINPPSKQKYCYWSAEKTPKDPEQWFKSAQETQGSWWPHWQAWIETLGDEKTDARPIKNSIEPAPGRYVKKSA